MTIGLAIFILIVVGVVGTILLGVYLPENSEFIPVAFWIIAFIIMIAVVADNEKLLVNDAKACVVSVDDVNRNFITYKSFIILISPEIKEYPELDEFRVELSIKGQVSENDTLFIYQMRQINKRVPFIYYGPKKIVIMDAPNLQYESDALIYKQNSPDGSQLEKL
jgi:hypothetical protein